MKKLLVFGAGFLQKFVIDKAVSMGYYVYVIDKDPHPFASDCGHERHVVDIVDRDACLKFAKEHTVDGVIAAATDFPVVSAAYVAEKLGLPGIDVKVAQDIRNKFHVRKILCEKGVDSVKQFYEITNMQAAESLKGKLSFPLMVKPCDGSSSRGVCRVDSFDEFVSACEGALEASRSKRALAEDFICGKEYGAESVVINGELKVLAIMKKDMTQPPVYSETGHAIPSGLDFEDKIKKTVENAVRALGINYGGVNMDMLITDSGDICIIDVGARMGGNMIGSHIIPLGTGIDYLGNLIRIAVGDEADWEPHGGSAVASSFLILTPGTVAALPDLSEIERLCDVKIYHHLTVGGTIRPYRENCDGCGYVVATGKTVSEAKQKADRAVNEVDKRIKRK